MTFLGMTEDYRLSYNTHKYIIQMIVNISVTCNIFVFVKRDYTHYLIEKLI